MRSASMASSNTTSASCTTCYTTKIVNVPAKPPQRWTTHGHERDSDGQRNRRTAENHPPADPQNDRKRRTPGRQGRPGVAYPARKRAGVFRGESVGVTYIHYAT